MKIKYKSKIGYCGEITDYFNELFKEETIYLFPPEELMPFEKHKHKNCKAVVFRKIGKTLGTIYLNKKGFIKDIALYYKKEFEDVINAEWQGKKLISYMFEE